MRTDLFTRFCLAAIVVLLAVIACRTVPDQHVHAATPVSYLFEDVSGISGKSDQQMTDHLNAVAKQGWHLNTTFGEHLIWEK